MSIVEDASKTESVVISVNDHSLKKAAEVDDALNFLAKESADGDFAHINEKKLLRKIDWIVMPLLFSVYYLQYTDKTLGNETQLAFGSGR